jgi:2-oxoglutarate ferredoxin oxidoreductase subunit beta
MTVHIPTDAPPARPARKVASLEVPLKVAENHHLCPGCGHPVAERVFLEAVAEAGLAGRVIGTIGHGCYTGICRTADIDWIQTLHGRAPAVATGIKRVHPDVAVFTIQGDGDMGTEGLHEVLHAAARAERITCIMLNNGLFGDTGGQMTASTVLGQTTKTTLEGRDPAIHGYPIPLAELIAHLPGAVYVARGAVHTAGAIAQTKKFLRRAIAAQMDRLGFTFVEILTMCPTHWMVPTGETPTYVNETIESTFPVAELKSPHP